MNRQNVRPWFDDIGLKYLENYAEIETAREVQKRQEEAITKYLAEIIRNALKETGREIKGEDPEDKPSNFFLAGSYADYRKERGKDETWAAGIGFYWGKDDLFEPTKPYVFETYMQFEMKKPTYGKVFERNQFQNLIRLLSKVEGVKPENLREGHEGSAYVLTFLSTPDRDDFTLDAFETNVLLLPRLFPVADEWVKNEYKSIKEMEE